MPPIENDVPPPSFAAFSSSTGLRPTSRAASAVATPPIPEPITTTSYISSKIMVQPPACARDVLCFLGSVHALTRIQECEGFLQCELTQVLPPSSCPLCYCRNPARLRTPPMRSQSGR